MLRSDLELRISDLTVMVQKQTIKLGFRPVVIGRRLLDVLPERSRDVVVSRFGLAENPERMTLEAIGDVYDVTRERIRQIEAKAIEKIRQHHKVVKLHEY